MERLADSDTRSVQLSQLDSLLRRGRRTYWGSTLRFDSISDYDDFRKRCPLTDYEAIRPLVERMINGERDLLWPGVTRRFAQSSGTTGGKSKYVPITDDSLRENHYRGGNYTVARYLQLYPDSQLFSGKSFILGGSYANTLGIHDSKVHIGDLSATLIDCINPLVNLARIPSKGVALMADWDEKLPALVEAGRKANVTNIAGVPSWFLTVLRRILERTGARTIHEVWPNLEVFFHGGIAFGPYRAEYDAITDKSKMHYQENYNASEGFFGVQAEASPGPMMLLTDCSVFYEFLPLGADESEVLPAWMVETGKVYELIITCCNGLWRYRIGDTVRIHSTAPVTFTIEGRTKAFINAFGEELMVWNADTAIENVCHATGAAVANYTAAPVYAECGEKGHHQWLIEWTTPPPQGVEDFAMRLDAELRRLNSDYDAKRSGDLFLDHLSIVSVPHEAFNTWLASTGKLGGQRKVPRLSNDRRIADAILARLETDSNTEKHKTI